MFGDQHCGLLPDNSNGGLLPLNSDVCFPALTGCVPHGLARGKDPGEDRR